MEKIIIKNYSNNTTLFINLTDELSQLDSGLKEYEFPKRIVREDYISNCYLTAWEKANKIYRERGEI